MRAYVAIRRAAFLGLLACAGLGCKAESVEARAVWVDGMSGGQERRIHVYDRGERYVLTVLGETEPRESILLAPNGRGLLVRGGEQGGVWFGLDDGRRMPLPLDGVSVEGRPVSFTARSDALWWLDDLDRSVTLVPLAAGLTLERSHDKLDTVQPLSEPGEVVWVISSSDAPILLTKDIDGGARFLRYPDDEHDVLALVREAEIDELPLPYVPSEEQIEEHTCGSATDCSSLIAIDPDGELAIAQNDESSLGVSWVEFDRRAPQLAGTLALPEPLASASTVRLLALLDRFVSVWVGPGFLYRWDRRTGRVDAEPLFAAPPLYWYSVARGRALVFLSASGATYYLDSEELRVVNLETTTCSVIGEPVVAPSGEWAAWTCRDETFDSPASSGAIVRVSKDGIERHVGISMATLAIDDDGDLLVYSVQSTLTDVVDGVAPTDRPRSLFVLSHAGTLTRIDEFEPAPAPIMMGEYATYVQAAALD